MIEFEQKMTELSDKLSPAAKALMRDVLKLEWDHRFGARTKLPDEFATKALKSVTTGSGSSA
jgi:hypothetical protein